MTQFKKHPKEFSAKDIFEEIEMEKRNHPIRYFLRWFYYGTIRSIASCKNRVKWGFQRMFRGYDDFTEWDLWDQVCRNIMIPVLKKYELSIHGYPEEVGSPEKWQAIIKKMRIGLEMMVKKEGREWLNLSPDAFKEKHFEQEAKIKEAHELLAKWARFLWD